MSLGNRRAEDSDMSSGESTPPVQRCSSSSSSSPSSSSSSSSLLLPSTSKNLYHKSRLPSRQFWMAVSSTKLSDLMGFTFKHGRPWAVAKIARMMHSEYVFCGFVAPFRGFLFSAAHYELNRQLLYDLTACALSMDPLIRNVALLEVLLLMLQNSEVRHEFEPLTNYADNHTLTKETGLKADPVLAVFLGYVAVHRIRELVRLLRSEDQGDPEFVEINLQNQRQKIRHTLQAALCVPNVTGDVFLELAKNYAEIDEEFNFDQLVKTYINRNPAHLSGFYFYLEVLQKRSDTDSKVRQLATMQRILHFSPADEVVLKYADTILMLGEIADVQDVASRIAQYLEHWDRKQCLKGWILLCSALVYGRKYAKPVEIMNQREFWWEYHFAIKERYDPVDVVKALFVSLITHHSHEYVCSVRNEPEQKMTNTLFESAYNMLNDVTCFWHKTLCDLFIR